MFSMNYGLNSSTNFSRENHWRQQAGGLLGKGPGEGTVKNNIPDSYLHFIFPVIAEEYGALVCALLVCIISNIF